MIFCNYIKIAFSSIGQLDDVTNHSGEETILIIVLPRKWETTGTECQIWHKTLQGDIKHKGLIKVYKNELN
jgi:hypothetical protein